MSVTATKTRFKTGEESPYDAVYRFDGYLDGTWTPAPTAEEREIELTRGETFPPIRSANKACWWKFDRQSR
jgi:hypothetical protein